MKSILATAFYTTVGMTVAGLVTIMSVDLAAYTLAAQGLPGVGADTPITGITVGVIFAGIVGGMALLTQGAKYLIRLGGDISTWRKAMDDATRLGQESIELAKVVQSAADNVHRNASMIEGNARNIDTLTKEVEALRRWREFVVDPSLIRSGRISRADLEGEASA